MGTIDLSKVSGLSGKVGPLVFYVTKNGKQVFRNHVKPTDPGTPKQVAHRAKFGLANKALSPLNKAITRGHPGDPNAYRAMVGKAYREAIEGEYPDFRDHSNSLFFALG